VTTKNELIGSLTVATVGMSAALRNQLLDSLPLPMRDKAMRAVKAGAEIGVEALIDKDENYRVLLVVTESGGKRQELARVYTKEPLGRRNVQLRQTGESGEMLVEVVNEAEG
jgi:hypothetical protein